MVTEINFEEIDFYYISKETPVRTFECCAGVGKEHLDEFLHEYALGYQDDKIACTIVAIYHEKIIGFITYGIDSLIHDYQDAISLGVENSDLVEKIPALRIYALGVAKNFNHQGIGTRLILIAIKAANKLDEVVPCPQIIVAAYEDAVEFYKKFSFEIASSRTQWYAKPHVLMFAAVKPE